MTTRPDPYPATREIPRSPAQTRARDARLDPGIDILNTEDYPSPRSRHPVHVYGARTTAVAAGLILALTLAALVLLLVLGFGAR